MIEEKPSAGLRDRVSPKTDYEVRQRSRMLVALALLLVALGMVVIKDWDFWFTPEQVAEEDEVADTTAAAPETSPLPAEPKPAFPVTKIRKRTPPKLRAVKGEMQPIVTNRAALPPLQVEVVVGDEHRMLRPRNNMVNVDLRPRSPAVVEPATADTTSSQGLPNHFTTDASERVRLSADTSQVLSHPVNPDYPLLARQMKVQGSVILQALIGRDGAIQDLRILSGPAILSNAAQEAVKQWRFKPFLQEGEPVETQAHITVNFTISTN